MQQKSGACVSEALKIWQAARLNEPRRRFDYTYVARGGWVGVPRLGWHRFRHTFRNWLDAVGTAVGVQQKTMRHASVATTMNIYGKGMRDSKLDVDTILLVLRRCRDFGVQAGQESTQVFDFYGWGGGIRPPDPLRQNSINNARSKS